MQPDGVQRSAAEGRCPRLEPLPTSRPTVSRAPISVPRRLSRRAYPPLRPLLPRTAAPGVATRRHRTRWSSSCAGTPLGAVWHIIGRPGDLARGLRLGPAGRQAPSEPHLPAPRWASGGVRNLAARWGPSPRAILAPGSSGSARTCTPPAPQGILHDRATGATTER